MSASDPLAEVRQNIRSVINIGPREVALELIGRLMEALAQTHRPDTDTDEALDECLAGLLLCGQPGLALKFYRMMVGKQALTTRPPRPEILYRLETRTREAVPPPPPSPVAPASEWGRRYAQDKSDPLYPLHATDFCVTFRAEDVVYLLNEHCESCGVDHRFNVKSNFLEGGTLLCPQCLAQKRVTETDVLAAAKAGFLKYFRQFEQALFSLYPEHELAYLKGEVLFTLLRPVISTAMLLRPLVHVRFMGLHSGRFGHFAGNTELHLCARDAGLIPSSTLDIFSYSGAISNRQLQRMWSRVLPISPLAKYCYLACEVIPGRERLIDYPYIQNLAVSDDDRDVRGLLEQTPLHLSFTPEEQREGQAALHRMGVPEGAEYICLNARDAAYLQTMAGTVNWTYHNYRNSTITHYLSAAKTLAQRGYTVFRMGAVVQQPLPADLPPGIIDYATRFRTEFLDIYLSATCRFFISTGTGLDAIPMVFRRPVVYVNFLPVEYSVSWMSQSVTIFKKLWLIEEKRALSFREIFASGAGRFQKAEEYQQAGIEVLENSPEEIIAAVTEMDERLKGAWKTTEEDEALQRRFWALLKDSRLHGVIRGRVGAEFLRQHRTLLD